MITNKTNTRIMSQRDIEESVMSFWSYTSDHVENLNIYHHHPQKVEFTLFMEGHGIYRIQNVDHEIRPGDLFFLGESKYHYIPVITEPLQVINLCFEPRFVWSQNTPFEDTHYLQLLFHLGKGVPCKFEAGDPLTERIRYLMLEMEKECAAKRSDYISAIRSMTVQILIELSRYVEDHGQKIAAPLPAIDYHSMNRSMNFIDENLDCQLTLTEIAGKANLSPTYYCNLFKKLNGITLWEYITTKRIDKAVQMLPDYQGNIIDLALSCGFNNTANFNRAFKKCMGMTPSEYKKKLPHANIGESSDNRNREIYHV